MSIFQSLIESHHLELVPKDYLAIPETGSSKSTVAPDDSGSASKGIKAKLKPEVPGPPTVMMWNIANLGGRFGYPPRRHPEIINFTADVIGGAEQKVDVCVVLEVLNGSTSKSCKISRMPQIRDLFRYRQREALDAAEILYENLIVDDSAEVSGGIEAEEKKEDESGSGTKQKAEAAPEAEAPAEPSSPASMFRVPESFVPELRELAKHIFTVFDEVEPKKLKVSSKELQKIVNLAIKKGDNTELTKWLESQWDPAVMKLVEADRGHANRFKKQAVSRIIVHLYTITAWARANFAELEVKPADEELSHSGLSELGRIASKLPVDRGEWVQWPVPDSGTIHDSGIKKNPAMARLYTKTETYGVFCRNGWAVHEVLRPASDKLPFVSRRPYVFVLRRGGTPASTVVIAWHAPSDSKQNSRTRGHDFRSYEKLVGVLSEASAALKPTSKAEATEAGCVELLLAAGDFNVDTLDPAEKAKHMYGWGKVPSGDFFKRLFLDAEELTEKVFKLVTSLRRSKLTKEDKVWNYGNCCFDKIVSLTPGTTGVLERVNTLHLIVEEVGKRLKSAKVESESGAATSGKGESGPEESESGSAPEADDIEIKATPDIDEEDYEGEESGIGAGLDVEEEAEESPSKGSALPGVLSPPPKSALGKKGKSGSGSTTRQVELIAEEKRRISMGGDKGGSGPVLKVLRGANRLSDHLPVVWIPPKH